jgi:hypothetical protein
MVDVLQVFSVIIVVLALVPALAHALELPGKLRLAQDAYFAVQPIYYPGFTVAGIAEPVAIVCTALLLFVTPRASADFWLALAALAALVGMHAVYWIFTHPVNNFWLRDEKLGRVGSGFFAAAQPAASGDPGQAHWKKLRNRWEYSHIARAVLAFAGFIALLLALSPASG